MLNNVLHMVAVRYRRHFYDGNALCQEALERGKPCMVARLGATEGQATACPGLPPPLWRFLRKRCIGNLHAASGVFPADERTIRKFAQLMLRDLQEVDILGSWRSEEALLGRHLRQAAFVPLDSLEPYFAADPWSGLLAGRRVLVVHPFKDSIEKQYKKRHLLFADVRVLPEFGSLSVVQALQSTVGNAVPFDDWFAALDWMKTQVDCVDYDVAIIGCGAYGLPLAAHIKRRGRIAIHLGGATQLMFGIMGRRWENHPVISRLANEHWVRPTEQERPANAELIDKASYW